MAGRADSITCLSVAVPSQHILQSRAGAYVSDSFAHEVKVVDVMVPFFRIRFSLEHIFF